MPGSDGDAVPEMDGEGVHGCFPAVGAGASFSSFEDEAVAVDMPPGDIPYPKVEQLDCGIVAGEMAAVLDDLPQLEVNRLDRVCRVDYLPDGGVELEERDELVPGPVPRGDQAGAFLPEVAAQLFQRPLRCGLVHGGVNWPHRGGGLLAVFPGHVFHRCPDEVDNASLHLRLRPGRLDRAGQAVEPVAAHEQDVLDSAVAELGEHARPEPRSLGD